MRRQDPKNLKPPPSEEVLNDYLHSIYTNVQKPGSFQGIVKLYKAVLDEGVYLIKLHEIQKWLQSVNAYTMNRPVKRVTKRPSVIVSGLYDQYETDLASLNKYEYIEQNDGVKYLLVVIDVFSRFIWVRPLKNKLASNVIKAFQNIFDTMIKTPRRMRSDRGSEFTSTETRKFMKERNIVQMFTSNELQANYVERVIKTIKSKIYRYLVNTNSLRYIDVLPKIVSSYNSTWHSGIRSKPEEVTEKNEKQLWWQMYWPKETLNEETKRLRAERKEKYKLNVGDFVRISLRKKAFQREYDERWSGEIFIVVSKFKRNGSIPMYKLTDYEGEKVTGTFYTKEIQKITSSPRNFFVIDKIIDERKINNIYEVKVSYKYWPRKFNRWIKKTTIINKNIN